MINPYNRGNSWGTRLRQLGLAALLLGGTAVAQAQTLNYAPSSTTNVAGTYTDLGATGTAIATANSDDANSAAQDIGFAFAYNGSSFTQFVFNTNGVIRLGNAAPSTAALYYDNNSDNPAGTDPLVSTNAADVNLLMPLNIDLVPGTGTGGADYRVLTSGSAPNRVCTIEWRNVADKAGVGADIANGTQYSNISFQIKLYETTNVIEFVYDAAVPGSTAAGTRFPNVGLKGSGLALGQLTLGLKATTAAWSTTTFQNTNYGTVAHNITKSVGPDAGRTYRFTPYITPANDIALRGVYTPGKIASPTALPQAVRVFIANQGTATQTNIAVTLTISGANTYTVTGTLASLAAGAQAYLTLANLPATLNAGTNTITVSVPNDGDNTNNSVSATQLVTATRLSQIDPSKAYDGAFSGYANNSTVFVTKFILPTTTTTALTDAIISFGNTGATTPYQVLVYDATGTGGLPGKVLYTSATQNRPATGGDITVTLPRIQLTGTFYLGVREAGTTGIGLATQSETPLRSTTFYFSADGASGWIDMAAQYPRRLGMEVGLAAAPTCTIPTALAVTSTTPTTATVTFTDASNTGSYQLVYGPVGFQPATEGTTATVTGSPATITGLTPGATYQVYIRSNCTGGGTSFFSAPVTFSTGCAAVTTIGSFPYTEGFDNIAIGQSLPCGLTVLDANNDKATWAITKATPYSGVKALRYTSALNNSVAADDWFFIPALTTTANTRYQLAFRYRGEGIAPATSSYIEKLEVKVGPSATPAGQTTTLFSNTNITNTSYALANATATPAVAVFTPGAGTQYVGFHVFSDANQGNLYIDDINITASVVTATSSAALLRAVTVFPNPSTTGLFDLEIHGAQAKGNLGVLVTNALGQQVYTGAARDNYTNRLDLGGLAPGLYYLQVRNGAETMTRQLAIVK
jgi:hypothetical protein